MIVGSPNHLAKTSAESNKQAQKFSLKGTSSLVDFGIMQHECSGNAHVVRAHKFLGSMSVIGQLLRSIHSSLASEPARHA